MPRFNREENPLRLEHFLDTTDDHLVQLENGLVIPKAEIVTPEKKPLSSINETTVATVSEDPHQLSVVRHDQPDGVLIPSEQEVGKYSSRGEETVFPDGYEQRMITYHTSPWIYFAHQLELDFGHSSTEKTSILIKIRQAIQGNNGSFLRLESLAAEISRSGEQWLNFEAALRGILQDFFGKDLDFIPNEQEIQSIFQQLDTVVLLNLYQLGDLQLRCPQFLEESMVPIVEELLQKINLFLNRFEDDELTQKQKELQQTFEPLFNFLSHFRIETKNAATVFLKLMQRIGSYHPLRYTLESATNLHLSQNNSTENHKVGFDMEGFSLISLRGNHIREINCTLGTDTADRNAISELRRADQHLHFNLGYKCDLFMLWQWCRVTQFKSPSIHIHFDDPSGELLQQLENLFGNDRNTLRINELGTVEIRLNLPAYRYTRSGSDKVVTDPSVDQIDEAYDFTILIEFLLVYAKTGEIDITLFNRLPLYWQHRVEKLLVSDHHISTKIENDDDNQGQESQESNERDSTQLQSELINEFFTENFELKKRMSTEDLTTFSTILGEKVDFRILLTIFAHLKNGHQMSFEAVVTDVLYTILKNNSSEVHSLFSALTRVFDESEQILSISTIILFFKSFKYGLNEWFVFKFINVRTAEEAYSIAEVAIEEFEFTNYYDVLKLYDRLVLQLKKDTAFLVLKHILNLLSKKNAPDVLLKNIGIESSTSLDFPQFKVELENQPFPLMLGLALRHASIFSFEQKMELVQLLTENVQEQQLLINELFSEHSQKITYTQYWLVYRKSSKSPEIILKLLKALKSIEPDFLMTFIQETPMSKPRYISCLQDATKRLERPLTLDQAKKVWKASSFDQEVLRAILPAVAHLSLQQKLVFLVQTAKTALNRNITARVEVGKALATVFGVVTFETFRSIISGFSHEIKKISSDEHTYQELLHFTISSYTELVGIEDIDISQIDYLEEFDYWYGRFTTTLVYNHRAHLFLKHDLPTMKEALLKLHHNVYTAIALVEYYQLKLTMTEAAMLLDHYDWDPRLSGSIAMSIDEPIPLEYFVRLLPFIPETKMFVFVSNFLSATEETLSAREGMSILSNFVTVDSSVLEKIVEKTDPSAVFSKEDIIAVLKKSSTQQRLTHLNILSQLNFQGIISAADLV